MGTAIGLGIGVVIGRNWNRIKKALSWLDDYICQEDDNFHHYAGYGVLAMSGLILLDRLERLEGDG
ncbi:MAG: hypothetical protein F6K47_37265 [Symploca sp. SIO2E6]|nr:hypothetical protein [Symploca sp. SIO2E6]